MDPLGGGQEIGRDNVTRTRYLKNSSGTMGCESRQQQVRPRCQCVIRCFSQSCKEDQREEMDLVEKNDNSTEMNDNHIVLNSLFRESKHLNPLYKQVRVLEFGIQLRCLELKKQFSIFY